MPHKVSRSDTRDDALDRYAAAVTAKAGAVSTIAPSGIGIDGMVVAPKRQMTYEIKTQTPMTVAAQRPEDDAAARDTQRRLLSGLPPQKPEPPAPVQVEATQAPTDDEILHTVEGLVPSVLAHRGRAMNRISASMISNLIDSLDVDTCRKRWLVSQVKTGIVDPDIFMRDLRLSLKIKR